MRTLKWAGLYLPLLTPLWLGLAGLVTVVLLLFNALYSLLFLIVFGGLSYWLTKGVLKRVDKGALYMKGDKHGRLFDMLLLLLVVAWGGFNFFFTTEHVFVDRDPGIYANTATWIAKSPTLSFENSRPFKSEYVFLNSSGFQPHPETAEILAQGQHFTPGVMGMVGRVVGLEGMFHSVVLFGMVAMLAVYGLARRIIGSQWAFFATAFLSVTLPFVHFSRDSYTEPISLALIMGGLTYVLAAEKTKSPFLWGLAGFIVSVNALNRVDAFLPTIGLIAYVYLFMVTVTNKKARRAAIPALLITPVMVLIGGLDIYIESRQYFDQLEDKYFQQLAAYGVAMFGGAIGAFIIIRFREFFKKLYDSVKNTLSVAGVVSYGLMMAMFMSMPIWRVTIGKFDKQFIENIQAREGLPLNGLQNYRELSIDWITNYIGEPIFLLGMIGIGAAVFTLVRYGRSAYTPLLFIFLFGTILYFVRPSITPDQIWAARRFLPVAYPAMVIFAAGVVGYVFSHLRFKDNTTKLAVLLLGAILVFYYPAEATARYSFVRQSVQHDTIVEVCDTFPARTDEKRSLVLWVGTIRQLALQSVHINCGDTVKSLGFGRGKAKDVPNQQILADLDKQFEDIGFDLMIGVLSSQADRIDTTGIESMNQIPYFYETIEETLTRRPIRVFDHKNTILIGEVMPDGSLAPVSTTD